MSAKSVSGTLIAFATKVGSTAEDGSGSHSPYTAALLRFLDNKQDIGIILRRVRESVMTTTRDRQQPWEYGSLIGEQRVLATMFRRKIGSIYLRRHLEIFTTAPMALP